jgi:predicted DNA-binding transcriptional regulator AlpA
MSVLHLTPPSPPPDRGKLLSVAEVAELVDMSQAWCRRHIPYKITLGHSTVRWHEDDVRRWLECKRAVD